MGDELLTFDCFVLMFGRAVLFLTYELAVVLGTTASFTAFTWLSV